MTRTYRIFIINPGSTSTKLSLFENDKNIYTTDVFHDSKVLLSFPTINDQLDYRMKVIYDFLKEDHIDLTGIASGYASIEDLGSLNGTWVDGAIVSRASLRDGSTVQIGTFRMVFHTNARPRRIQTEA